VTYEEHAKAALENFAAQDPAARYLLVDAVGDLNIERVLDLGCGPGQELIPFIERTGAHCVGVDLAAELGKVTAETFPDQGRAGFVRANGGSLPFADESFDVVICRVALPYMHNRDTIAETARVLKPNGVFLLKTHAPRFYLAMIRERLPSSDPKMLAYPLICLFASLWHSATRRQLEQGFWQGKEIFQTTAFLEKEFARNNLQIDGRLADDNPLTPSYRVVKSAARALVLLNTLGMSLAI
jgi:SAM-dependent methyltransferase